MGKVCTEHSNLAPLALGSWLLGSEQRGFAGFGGLVVFRDVGYWGFRRVGAGLLVGVQKKAG